MIGVQRDPCRRAHHLQRIDGLVSDPGGIGDRHAGVNPNDPDVIDGGEAFNHRLIVWRTDTI